MNLERDKIQLKICLDWIRSCAAQNAVDGGQDHHGQIFSIAHDAINNPRRTELLKEAPQWLRQRWPKYFGTEVTEGVVKEDASNVYSGAVVV